MHHQPTEISPSELKPGDIISYRKKFRAIVSLKKTDDGLLARLSHKDQEKDFLLHPVDKITRVSTQELVCNWLGGLHSLGEQATKIVGFKNGKIHLTFEIADSTLEQNEELCELFNRDSPHSTTALLEPKVTTTHIAGFPHLRPNHPDYPEDGDGQPVPVPVNPQPDSLNPPFKFLARIIVRSCFPAEFQEIDGYLHCRITSTAETPEEYADDQEMLKLRLKSSSNSFALDPDDDNRFPVISGFICNHPQADAKLRKQFSDRLHYNAEGYALLDSANIERVVGHDTTFSARITELATKHHLREQQAITRGFLTAEAHDKANALRHESNNIMKEPDTNLTNEALELTVPFSAIRISLSVLALLLGVLLLFYLAVEYRKANEAKPKIPAASRQAPPP